MIIEPRVFELKVHLKDSPVSIWRTFQIDSATFLPDLHLILQCVMGWNNSHLHSFRHGGLFYEEQNPEYWTDKHRDQEDVQISHLLRAPGDELQYYYDFGDDWVHEVKLLDAYRAEKNQGLPRCSEGQNACPPDDVGGVHGYEEFLKALEDSSHEDHRVYLDWIGESFDPKAFDARVMSRDLIDLFG